MTELRKKSRNDINIGDRIQREIRELNKRKIKIEIRQHKYE